MTPECKQVIEELAISDADKQAAEDLARLARERDKGVEAAQIKGGSGRYVWALGTMQSKVDAIERAIKHGSKDDALLIVKEAQAFMDGFDGETVRQIKEQA